MPRYKAGNAFAHSEGKKSSALGALRFIIVIIKPIMQCWLTPAYSGPGRKTTHEFPLQEQRT